MANVLLKLPEWMRSEGKIPTLTSSVLDELKIAGVTFAEGRDDGIIVDAWPNGVDDRDEPLAGVGWDWATLTHQDDG